MGSVTVIGAVSPPGGDLTEPVTAQTQRFVRCLWSLDRDLAYARHYPAVSLAGSFSRDADALGGWYVRNGDPEWARRRARVTALLAEADRLAVAGRAGRRRLAAGARARGDARRPAAAERRAAAERAVSPNDVTCGPAKGAALGDAVLAVVDRCQELVESGVPATALEEVDFGAAAAGRATKPAPTTPRAWPQLRDDAPRRLEELT